MNQHKRCVLEGGLTSYLNATLETLSVLPHQRLPLSPSYKCRPFAPDSPFPPGGGDGNPLQYPCWGNPTYRGAWRATGRGVAESVMTESLRTLFPASASSAGASFKRPQSGRVIRHQSPGGGGASPLPNSDNEWGGFTVPSRKDIKQLTYFT